MKAISAALNQVRTCKRAAREASDDRTREAYARHAVGVYRMRRALREHERAYADELATRALSRLERETHTRSLGIAHAMVAVVAVTVAYSFAVCALIA